MSTRGRSSAIPEGQPRETATGLRGTVRANGDHDGEARPGSQHEVVSAAQTQDERSVRAKNSGHGKKTADKWNQ